MQMKDGATRLLSPSEGANYKRGLLADSHLEVSPCPPAATGLAGWAAPACTTAANARQLEEVLSFLCLKQPPDQGKRDRKKDGRK